MGSLCAYFVFMTVDIDDLVLGASVTTLVSSMDSVHDFMLGFQIGQELCALLWDSIIATIAEEKVKRIY